MDVTVGWPGSVADGRIWTTSSLYRRLDELFNNLPSTSIPTLASDTSEIQHELVPAYILADSTYPSTARMVPTFRNTDCDRCQLTKQLNFKLASIRYCIENAFGICKGRFRILDRLLEYAKENIKRSVYLILAIFTLHNFLINIQDDTVIELADVEMEFGVEGYENAIQNENDENMDTKSILLRHMRWDLSN